jgi:hypothetical protein
MKKAFGFPISDEQLTLLTAYRFGQNSSTSVSAGKAPILPYAIIPSAERRGIFMRFMQSFKKSLFRTYQLNQAILASFGFYPYS